MNRVAAWWSSLGFGRAIAPVDDYADMGTAFGLDASLDTVPSAYTAVPSAGTDARGAPEPSGFRRD
jgi:hypothetical protein